MPKNNDPGDWESRYRAELKKNPGSIGLLMEGDSWFSFPNLLRTNIYMALDLINGPKAAIWSLAHSGDTAHEIAFGDQFELLSKLFRKKNLRIDGFLFSAGGNDIVGNNLLSILNEYRPGMSWRDCIDESYLTAKLKDIRDAYERIIGLRDESRPEMPIFTHSYDFAVPSGDEVRLLWLPIAGGWLKDKFEFRGIQDPKLQRAILNYLLEEFAELIESLASKHAQLIHVKTQGTLSEDEWGDELHPTMAGYKKIAAKFQAALHLEFPSLPSA
jgi:hypothetical protein